MTSGLVRLVLFFQKCFYDMKPYSLRHKAFLKKVVPRRQSSKLFGTAVVSLFILIIILSYFNLQTSFNAYIVNRKIPDNSVQNEFKKFNLAKHVLILIQYKDQIYYVNRVNPDNIENKLMKIDHFGDQ